MVWSEAVGSAGRVVGLELSDEYAGIARRGLADNGVGNVEVVVGDAVSSLRSLRSLPLPGGEGNAEAEGKGAGAPFDLVFVDANKDAYPEYLDLLLARSPPGAAPGDRLLKAGGLIVADNVLRRGIVADSTPSNPHYTREMELHGAEKSEELVRALRVFNDKVAAEPRLEAFLMPLFDGLTLARLKD